MIQKNKNKKPTNDDPAVALVTILMDFTALNLGIIWKGLKGLKAHSALHAFLALSFVSIVLISSEGHLFFLHWIYPSFFDFDLILALKSYGVWYHFFFLLSFFSSFYLWCVGLISMIRFRRYQNALDELSLKNAQDFTPKVVGVHKKDDFQKVVKVMVPGIGSEELSKVQKRLEASLGSPIEEIKSCPNPKFAEVVVGKQEISNLVYFDDLEVNLKESEFMLGKSKKGLLKSNLKLLPHMLIAGTTGNGKSCFFKQMLLGLLSSTNHLQMYLIDLKGGLEFRSFSSLSNVQVVKTIEDSVTILKLIKEEMDSRFRYLENRGLEFIDPRRDKFDHVVLGIDECSVLYSKSFLGPKDRELISEARSLTEHIAKLSRAAGIHLVLATQKVTKETIDTRIQENISGRMCFKLNTIEGSIRVLGNNSACHLPNISGRGIWQLGNEQSEVQVPYLDSSSLKEKLEVISQKYQSGEKSLRQDMLKTKESDLSNFITQVRKIKQRGSFEEL